MRLIEKVWFHGHAAKWLLVPVLLPLTVLFALVSWLRRLAYQLGVLSQVTSSVPVVVVGNIGIGGNGKTPLVLYLVEQLSQQGIKVGVVSRGYGAKAPHYPYHVTAESSAIQAGDEPLLIQRRSGVDVVIGADRVQACQRLIELGCELIIADDGLQHYRLARAFEFIVVDGRRLFGNGLLLPAGPLRERIARIKSADCVVVNGESTWPEQASKLSVPVVTMQLSAKNLVHVKSGRHVKLADFLQQQQVQENGINAIAGIGDPQRFFNSLTQYGFKLNDKQGFVDHQAYTEQDLRAFAADMALLMTEKDAVKCAEFAQENYWYVPVDAMFTAHQGSDTMTHIVATLAALADKRHQDS
ncbi:lipid-A-disaccharide kinase [Colwellia chukchiensis]|uniref:Tetraacyldisaccharide 4'-kinase n=1 Tax=Colwellia chukchiensis TaxID=641665 RepID=A0A1H7FZJ7_9GAMM|nr:tetraacyldisaccharide 4'-kinase [Colwellia chukchiensis]SEK31476.1 lipid-A-disaccharide kinase [Colwellia chukchiensis]